ncbi:nicotinamide riboside transporter PnuC [Acetobacter fallax]|uniref:Nicotinamide riboside transporter PnuC n=1 Tax=Acetobacter fallax TaxID=1737473 RepID=A0ABX0KIE9_9PROT|nr:nicotinamide riboside transporter PnuC [Acetobacter fallax]NHO33677.1 nicotinamide riboside transporter PnuC [Acetobacter fallax]NHO36500.1 nicotinamide riboside transporter PnuC [Acetobacter fallax]
MSPLEVAAVVINVLGVWLTARRNMLCWPVGIVAVLLYARLFFVWKLYDDMVLQGVYVIVQIYGWKNWTRARSEGTGAIQVIPLPSTSLTTGVAAATLSSLALGAAMAVWTDDPLPWIDATLTCFSLLASFWSARRHIENWYLWIAVDAAYTLVFLYRQNDLTAGLYAMFDALALYGALNWRSVRERHTNKNGLSRIP